MNDVTYTLRDLCFEDTKRMTEMMHDAATTRFLFAGGEGYTEETARSFIERCAVDRKNLHQAIIDENGQFSGTISLKNIDIEKMDAEYAITLHPDSQGKGVAKVASKLIFRIAFDTLKLSRVYLNVLDENERANRLYKKLGFLLYDVTEIEHKGEKKKLNWYYINQHN